MSTAIFSDVFKHSIDGIRTGSFETEDRVNRLRHKKEYDFFYKFGSSGFITYTFLQVIKVSSLTLNRFREGIVDDHTSGPIKAILLRSGIGLEEEISKIFTKKSHSLHGFFALIKSAVKAYKEAKPANIVEFARCIQITKYTMVYYGYFISNIAKYVLIADTFNPKRQALGLVCDLLDVPVYSFAVVKAGIRTASPFKVNTYFCWTQEHKDFLLKSTKSNVVLMNSPASKDIRIPIKDNASYGLLLNAKYIAKNIQIFINTLRKNYGIENIQIRPHPGHNKALSLENAVIRNWQESLDSFLDSVDCVFAPNTNAMTEALQQGIPVVYVQNLGEGPYDMYEMVKKNLVLSFDTNISLPYSVNDFYGLESTKASLKIFNESFQRNDNSETDSVLSILNINNYSQ